MIITIIDDNQKIELSTEHLNTLNFVDVALYTKIPKGDEELKDAPYVFKESMTVPLYELISAVHAFEESRKILDEKE